MWRADNPLHVPAAGVGTKEVSSLHAEGVQGVQADTGTTHSQKHSTTGTQCAMTTYT